MIGSQSQLRKVDDGKVKFHRVLGRNQSAGIPVTSSTGFKVGRIIHRFATKDNPGGMTYFVRDAIALFNDSVREDLLSIMDGVNPIRRPCVHLKNGTIP